MALGKERGQAWHYVPGFGSLADFIASDSDHSTAVYRRFDRLSSRNLLYYQSELARLEAIQDRFDIEDRRGVEDLKQADSWESIRCNARDWDTLGQAAGIASHNADTPSSTATSIDERGRRRMAIAMEIRRTIKDYQEALIRESTVLSLERPSAQTMEALSNHFHNTSSNGSSNYTILSGDSSQLYPRGMSSLHIQASDYVSLAGHQESDLLTRFLKTYCTRLFRVPASSILPQHQGDIITHLPKEQIMHYSLESVKFAASFIATSTAAILLFLPILTLDHTANLGLALNLGLIALFTFLFACAIFLMTQARRAEIFGVCAAYAAVLVVFASSGFGGAGIRVSS
ncbi:hypothetical protein GQX73_g9659 [Xylaria multiplex]|uniref:DUF6594 domain-containing protein n=1 Tax=Xylaria multiplex TaxID=323545 RepID=A0A7C8IU70_9PEZI|nr:hypothetical protein GQX73_g9659 [Xylaria multiplex]